MLNHRMYGSLSELRVHITCPNMMSAMQTRDTVSLNDCSSQFLRIFTEAMKCSDLINALIVAEQRQNDG